VPLFVVLAQAAPKPEAGRAVITSPTSPAGRVVNLSDPASTNILIGAGDVVHLIARPQEFIYVGGEIMQPGRKDFHSGVTLTQLLLECGGVTRPNSSKIYVRVSRQDRDGRLVSQEYKLVEIESGQIADPAIQPGDRIIVERDR
jgi:protein involved in polysaccharide export with SLBB domain